MPTRPSRRAARRSASGAEGEGQPSRAQQRAEARIRRAEAEARARKKMLIGYSAAILVLAGATTFLGGGGSSSLANFLPDGPGLPMSLIEDRGAERISELTSRDVQQMNRQRAAIDELARRYVGTTPTGNLDDIRILQEILDARAIERDQVWELQALGVVLGDVMARNMRLEWVVVDDEYGRSRALRHGTGSDLVFPVTLISKRFEAGYTIYIDQLYDKITTTVRGFRGRS